MNHDELAELLGAYALDAVSPEEAAEIEAHLPECPRCRAELQAHLQVAGVLGNLGGSAPAGLWDRIAGELAIGSGGPLLSEEPDGGGADLDEKLPRAPSVAPVIAMPDSRSGRSADASGTDRAGAVVSSGSSSNGRLRAAVIAAVSIAAGLAIVVGVLASTVSSLNDRVSHLSTAVLTGGVEGQVQAALADPSHQIVELTSKTAPWKAEVVLAEGKGWLVPSKMPTVPASKTYQAWAYVKGAYVSLGVIGSSPSEVALGLQPGMSEVLVNVEPQGGSAQPTTPPVVSGALPATL